MASIQTVLKSLGKEKVDVHNTETVPNQFYDLHSLDQVLNIVSEVKAEEKLQSLKSLSSLVEICPQFWIVEYIKLFDSDRNRKINEKSLLSLLKYAHVQGVKNVEHHEYEKSNFPNAADKAVGVMSLVSKLLDSAFSESVKGVHFLSSILGTLVLLIIEHLNDKLWTSKPSVQIANNIWEKLLYHFQLEHKGSLLLLDTQSYVMDMKHPDFNNERTINNIILKEICTELNKENWKRNPALVTVFTTILFWMKFPHMSTHLVQVLPLSLIFVDDFVPDNKILGVRCLHHIICNVSAEELRWYGRAEVVYEALKHQLYTHKVNMISVLHPALLSILKVVEKNPAILTSQKEMVVNRYDEIYQMIVTDAVGEQNLRLRESFTKCLPDFVLVMGITVVKHWNMSLNLISSYLEVYGGTKDTACLNVLDLLEKHLQYAWPRMHCHCDRILRMLIKYLIDISMEQSHVLDKDLLDKLMLKVSCCLSLLKHVNEDMVCESLSTLKNVTLPTAVHQTINEVITAEQM